MSLEPALFPQRHWIGPRERDLAEQTPLGGDAATRNVHGPVEALRHWVCGGSFHQYGRRVLDALAVEHGVEEAVRAVHEHEPRLTIRGDLAEGNRIRWLVSYQRAGDPDANGFHSGSAFLEDACYAALTMIEEHERENYEQALVVGTA